MQKVMVCLWCTRSHTLRKEEVVHTLAWMIYIDDKHHFNYHIRLRSPHHVVHSPFDKNLQLFSSLHPTKTHRSQ